MASEIVEAPSHAQSFKHREVGARVRTVGIDERAVPVKENGASREAPAFHQRIVAEICDYAVR